MNLFTLPEQKCTKRFLTDSRHSLHLGKREDISKVKHYKNWNQEYSMHRKYFNFSKINMKSL